MLRFALAVFLVANCVQAQEPLRLYNESGLGPLAIWSDIYEDRTGWTAGIKNESKETIKAFCLCVRAARDKDGCRVLSKCYTHRLAPGESFHVSEPTTARGHGFPGHQVILLSMSHVIPLDDVHKLYVEEMTGSAAGFGRDQLMAAIVANSSGRFELVEDPSAADAIITGRAESRDTGQIHSTETRASEGVSGSLLGRASATGSSIGSVTSASSTSGATVAASRRAASQELDRTDTITRESLILRLVRAGKTLWAWDGSKPCDQSEPKAKCAIDDLVIATNQ